MTFAEIKRSWRLVLIEIYLEKTIKMYESDAQKIRNKYAEKFAKTDFPWETTKEIFKQRDDELHVIKCKIANLKNVIDDIIS